MENVIVRALTRVFDLVLLNILWVLCSIPILTVGAATTALYSVMLKLVKNEEGYIAKDFFRTFRRDFKMSTMIWIPLLILGIFLCGDLMIIWGMSGIVKYTFMLGLSVILILYIIEVLFVFPILATFENTLKQTLKNALLIPISRLPYAILIIIITVGCIIVTLLNEVTVTVGAVLWCLIGVAILSYINSILINKLLDPYLE